MEKANKDRGKLSVWGWLFIGSGLAVIAIATDLLPTDDANFGAPRWLIGIAGSIFVIAGLMILLGEKSNINNFLAGCLLTGMGLVGGWVGIFGSDQGFSGGIPFVPETVNISIARGIFGIGSLFCLLMAAYAFKLQLEDKGDRDSGNNSKI